jgi:hypothetical protein
MNGRWEGSGNDNLKAISEHLYVGSEANRFKPQSRYDHSRTWDIRLRNRNTKPSTLTFCVCLYVSNACSTGSRGARQTDDRLSRPSMVKFGRLPLESVMGKRKSITQWFLRRQRNNDDVYTYKKKKREEGFVPCSLSIVTGERCNTREAKPP